LAGGRIGCGVFPAADIYILRAENAGNLAEFMIYERSDMLRQIANKYFFTFIFALILITESYGGPLEEYKHLLVLLRNYNKPGYIQLINSGQGIQYQRGKIVKTGSKLSFIPHDKGFFQFYDADKKALCYSRNLNLTINNEGLLCNDSGLPLFPEVRVDIDKPYQIKVESGELKIKYNDLPEKQISLYWPKEIEDAPEYSDVFYFNEVDVLTNARVISGFFELSAVDIQVTLVKMLALIPVIEEQYARIVFYSGSSSNTVHLLNSLFILSYLIRAESSFKDMPVSEYYIDMDPLKIDELWVFLQIKGDGVIYHSRETNTGFTGVQLSSHFVYESRKLIVAVDEEAGIYEIIGYGE
jgi:hypothetical protein